MNTYIQCTHPRQRSRGWGRGQAAWQRRRDRSAPAPPPTLPSALPHRRCETPPPLSHARAHASQWFCRLFISINIGPPSDLSLPAFLHLTHVTAPLHQLRAIRCARLWHAVSSPRLVVPELRPATLRILPAASLRAPSSNTGTRALTVSSLPRSPSPPHMRWGLFIPELLPSSAVLA